MSFRWCALPKEQAKCADFIKYVNMTAQSLNLHVTTECVAGSSSDDCITKIDNNQADLVTLDGRKVYDAGNSHNFTFHWFYSGPLASPSCNFKQHFMKLRHWWHILRRSFHLHLFSPSVEYYLHFLLEVGVDCKIGSFFFSSFWLRGLWTSGLEQISLFALALKSV